jgi:hypothetical protein
VVGKLLEQAHLVRVRVRGVVRVGVRLELRLEQAHVVKERRVAPLELVHLRPERFLDARLVIPPG